MADHVNDSHSAATHPVNSTPNTSLPQIQQEDITVATRSPPTHRTPRQHQNNPRPCQQNKSKSTDNLCYYHTKFGSEACNCRPGCLWPKKLTRWLSPITVTPGNNVFFLHKPATGIRFLIDTGASCSLLLALQWKKSHQPQTNVKLPAAKVIPISTYSHQHLTLQIRKRN